MEDEEKIDDWRENNRDSWSQHNPGWSEHDEIGENSGKHIKAEGWIHIEETKRTPKIVLGSSGYRKRRGQHKSNKTIIIYIYAIFTRILQRVTYTAKKPRQETAPDCSRSIFTNEID